MTLDLKKLKRNLKKSLKKETKKSLDLYFKYGINIKQRIPRKQKKQLNKQFSNRP